MTTETDKLYSCSRRTVQNTSSTNTYGICGLLSLTHQFVHQSWRNIFAFAITSSVSQGYTGYSLLCTVCAIVSVVTLTIA